VISENGQVLAENMILKRRLTEAEMIICARQECKNDKRNVLIGRNVISMPEILGVKKK
jgi:hypothetical protein